MGSTCWTYFARLRPLFFGLLALLQTRKTIRVYKLRQGAFSEYPGGEFAPPTCGAGRSAAPHGRFPAAISTRHLRRGDACDGPPGELAARNLNAVLVQYMTQRGNLEAAVNHISQCQNVTANANVIAGIAASRTAEIGPAVVDRLGGPAERAGHKG
jgi:hypothetical protein